MTIAIDKCCKFAGLSAYILRVEFILAGMIELGRSKKVCMFQIHKCNQNLNYKI
jgi:hypothetical protein